MSESADKLAQTRLAIIEHIHRKEHRNDAPDRAHRSAKQAHGHVGEGDGDGDADEPGPSANWGASLIHGFQTWWRHHPAHLAVELATPVLSGYARRKPAQFLAIAAAAGVAVMLIRPWKLISATGLVVALLKSSQLSSLVMSAMSAADFQKDAQRPR